MVDQGRLTDVVRSVRPAVRFPDAPVVVGLSGGADSAALLWLLVDHGVRCRAVHVIHGLPASPLMATAAGQVAARLGVDLTMVTVDPAGTSESDLRDARHAALLADRSDDEVVALAHTLDDQAETVLMRMLRGTGVEGLGAMDPDDDRFVRPLLTVGRAEIRRLAAEAGLPFRDDPANDDPGPLRNRIRAELLPLLDDLSGSDVRRRLAGLAAIAREESSLLAARAAAVPVQVRAGSARVPVGALHAVGPVVAARVVRDVFRRLRPPYPPDRAAVERVLSVTTGEIAGTEVGAGVSARVEGAHLVLGPPIRPIGSWELCTLAPDDELVVPGWKLSARWFDGPRPAPSSLRRCAVPAAVAGPLLVRPVAEDDRITGRRVTAALADVGVPAAAREGWPVVVLADEVIWVPAVRRRVWSGATSGRYLCLTAFEEPAWQTSAP